MNSKQKFPSILIGTNGMRIEALRDSFCKLSDKYRIGFDTAPNYHSEETIGKIISYQVSSGQHTRENFFVQTKLDVIDQIKGTVEDAFYKSLKLLNVDYVDAYLMHWPNPTTFTEDWKILEKLKKQGLIHHIGVCNFRERHWKKLLDSNIEIIPEINQIEIHPLRICESIIDFCNKQGIVTQAYSPICKMLPPISQNPTLIEISQRYNVSIPELILAWHVSRGVAPITKSSRLERLLSNIQSALTLKIDNSDIVEINRLDQDYKFFVESWGCPGF